MKNVANFYKSISSVFVNDINIRIGVNKVLKKLHDCGCKIIIITARSDNYYWDAYKTCKYYLSKKGVVYDKLLI